MHDFGNLSGLLCRLLGGTVLLPLDHLARLGKDKNKKMTVPTQPDYFWFLGPSVKLVAHIHVEELYFDSS